MDGLMGDKRLHNRSLRLAFIVAATLITTSVCIMIGQLTAAALVPCVGLLLARIEHRNARLRVLARQIACGHGIEKLEVSPGDWGELCHAINGMIQEQRMQQRLQTAAPVNLPTDAVQALMNGGLPGADTPRIVTVLLVSCGVGAYWLDSRERRASLIGWQALAHAARKQAQQHDALLQPCGDAMMLVFGAFSDRPADVTLNAALLAANNLQSAWLNSGVDRDVSLALSLASGPAMVTLLSGVGCCVLGAPIEQALQIQRIALSAQQHRLLCDASAYYALRRSQGVSWSPTEFRVPSGNGNPQVVYSLNNQLPGAPPVFSH